MGGDLTMMIEGSREPVLEAEQIETLIASAGVEVTASILEAFWVSNDELVKALNRQLSQGALSDAAKSAHALKGSAANLGAVALADIAKMLEMACRNEQANDAETHFKQIPDSIEVAKIAMEELLKSA